MGLLIIMNEYAFMYIFLFMFLLLNFLRCVFSGAWSSGEGDWKATSLVSAAAAATANETF
jgi:hypothetical protein